MLRTKRYWFTTITIIITTAYNCHLVYMPLHAIVFDNMSRCPWKVKLFETSILMRTRFNSSHRILAFTQQERHNSLEPPWWITSHKDWKRWNKNMTSCHKLIYQILMFIYIYIYSYYNGCLYHSTFCIPLARLPLKHLWGVPHRSWTSPTMASPLPSWIRHLW